ncbi:MAG TPA: hypothetical protein VF521_18120 [Pyrinomonadaceae bacterium]
MRERVRLDAHVVEPRSVRDRYRFDVRARENLDADGELRLRLHRAADDRHRRHDLRPDRAAQVRHVVHVLNHQSVHAAVAVDRRLAHGRVC